MQAQFLMQKYSCQSTMPNSKLTFNFYFMSPKYDECDKYGWDTTIYKNNHVAQ